MHVANAMEALHGYTTKSWQPHTMAESGFRFRGAKLKDNINNNSKKLLIYINYKINEQL